MIDNQHLFKSLLDRDVVPPDENLMRTAIRGKAIMVSGAGGSVGMELCLQLQSWKPATLILFENSEYALHSIENILLARNGAAAGNSCTTIVPVLGSIQDADLVNRVLAIHHVDTIYHAAAYKHVPMLEENVITGVRNNVFGTLTLALAAEEHGVGQFILISTDKAVRPASVMGATKRVAEQVLQALHHQGARTCFSMVRFGNVLGSSGSVLPLFHAQILQGGPVTVTHPEASRFFMTACEAAQLVIQSGALASGGEVHVLDMHRPLRIADMARKLIALMGFEVCNTSAAGACDCERGIHIEYTGLRPGEKLSEELATELVIKVTDHPGILCADESFHTWPVLSVLLKHLKEACNRMDKRRVRQTLIEAASVNPAGTRPKPVKPVLVESRQGAARQEKSPAEDLMAAANQ
jgi:FlaA1/EpsC-like NDP-sugar epimerase